MTHDHFFLGSACAWPGSDASRLRRAASWGTRRGGGRCSLGGEGWRWRHTAGTFSWRTWRRSRRDVGRSGARGSSRRADTATNRLLYRRVASPRETPSRAATGRPHYPSRSSGGAPRRHTPDSPSRRSTPGDERDPRVGRADGRHRDPVDGAQRLAVTHPLPLICGTHSSRPRLSLTTRRCCPTRYLGIPRRHAPRSEADTRVRMASRPPRSPLPTAKMAPESRTTGFNVKPGEADEGTRRAATASQYRSRRDHEG